MMSRYSLSVGIERETQLTNRLHVDIVHRLKLLLRPMWLAMYQDLTLPRDTT